MATVIREVLNADGMSLTLFCGGASKAGFSLLGTWAGTVKFFGSTDGLNFNPITVTPFASGTGVQSTTANGNWEVSTANYQAVRMTFTRTSGSVTATIAVSIDASYQIAFLAAGARNVNSVASGAANTLTVAAQANRAWRLRTLTVTVDSTPTWAALPNVKVTDGAGGTILWAGDLPAAAGVYAIPLPADPGIPGITGGGIVGTPATALVVVVASGAGSVKTNINAEIVPA